MSDKNPNRWTWNTCTRCDKSLMRFNPFRPNWKKYWNRSERGRVIHCPNCHLPHKRNEYFLNLLLISSGLLIAIYLISVDLEIPKEIGTHLFIISITFLVFDFFMPLRRMQIKPQAKK